MAEIHARHALYQIGQEPGVPLTPVTSVNNEVWLTDTHVVRVNLTGNLRLSREATIGAALPPTVSRPEYVGSGVGAGQAIEWCVVKRCPGQPLSRTWPSMDPSERAAAMERLAISLRALHQTPAPPTLDRGSALQLIDATSNRLAQASRHARERNRLSPSTGAALDLFFDATMPALEHHITMGTLIHGDLVFENIMWDGTEIYLLDFEFCRAAPPELELDVLMRFCGYPHLHSPPGVAHALQASQFREVPRLLEAGYPELFTSERLFDRLMLYAIGYELRLLLDPNLEEGSQDLCRGRIDSILEGRSHLHWLRSVAV